MFWIRVDPGPCPICGAPHTSCTSPDYQPTANVTPPVTPLPVASTEAPTFSTKTYRRGMLKRSSKSAPP